MADLLECLIQIKALGDTPRRLALRAAEAREDAGQRRGKVDARISDIAWQLAAADAWALEALEAMLDQVDPVLRGLEDEVARCQATPGEDPEAIFANRRRMLAARFERCSAADMSRTARLPGRLHCTVADLAAIVLAHDTDQLGRLRQGDRPPVAQLSPADHS